MTIDEEVRVLKNAGWKQIKMFVWQSPMGPIFLGPHGAYQEMLAHPELNDASHYADFLAEMTEAGRKAYLKLAGGK